MSQLWVLPFYPRRVAEPQDLERKIIPSTEDARWAIFCLGQFPRLQRQAPLCPHPWQTGGPRRSPPHSLSPEDHQPRSQGLCVWSRTCFTAPVPFQGGAPAVIVVPSGLVFPAGLGAP